MAVGGIWAAYKQTISEKALREKSEEIAELNKSIARSITGGDSFAYLLPIFQKGSYNAPLLTAVHHGDYPLYDLNARIVDLDKFEKMTAHEYSFNEIQKNEQYRKIGNLAPSRSIMLGSVQINGTQLRWNIFFNARNGFFTEELRIVKVGDTWKIAIRVLNTPTSGEVKTLYEKVDDGFPINDKGNVEW
jgi:hypothetical protein